MRYLRKPRIWYLKAYTKKLLKYDFDQNVLEELDEILTLILTEKKKELEEQKNEQSEKQV